MILMNMSKLVEPNYVSDHTGIYRASMTELLFEGYSVPKVSYGLDALFSAYLNISPAFDSQNSSFLVISVGFHTVTFIPVLEGSVATEGVRRVNIGGFHLTNYACRSMQVSWSGHRFFPSYFYIFYKARISKNRTKKHRHWSIHLFSWQGENKIRKKENKNV